MQTSFIYSASRVNTLAQYLLTKADIDRLLVAAPGAELQSAIKETYLAPFVLQVVDENVAEAIEQTLIDAKKLIHRVAPDGDMFRVLWVQYDIHNLRVIAKAQAVGHSYAEIEPLLSKRGIYEPSELFTRVEASELNRLQSGWQEAYDVALRLVEAGELSAVDGVFDELYFKTLDRIAVKSHDAFILRYTRAFLDLYNLKAQLRKAANPQVTFTPVFVSGGSFSLHEIDSKESALQAFANIGGDAFWREAIEVFEETGNTTQIDARADEYMINLAKQASFDMFSSASLVLYYLQCRQSAANIRTIVVGKNSGMSEADIRRNLRMTYVND